MQGHGGFMQVLDPDGQVLTKSPTHKQHHSVQVLINKHLEVECLLMVLVKQSA